MEGKPISKLPDLGTTIFTEMTALANRHGALNLAQGFPDIPPPQGLVEAAIKALQDGIHQYAPMAGRPTCAAGFVTPPANAMARL